MFKFNFKRNDTDKDEFSNATPDYITSDRNEVVTQEVINKELHKERADGAPYSQLSAFGWTFRHVQSNVVEEHLLGSTEASNSVTLALKTNSDVVKGVYEGGLKIWECTLDLMEYILKGEIKFDGLKVLDLGCGSGLLGILSYCRGAAAVHFQDYNIEVLDHMTIPNCILNPPVNQIEIKYFAGDWKSLPSFLDEYNIILTSETIYNPENYGKIVNVIDKSLKEDGCVYLAAKSHYFGVGGDLRQFQRFVETEKGWKSSVLFTTQDGVRREIIQIKKK